MAENISELFTGAMTGFAIGDAFGLPIRTMDYDSICERFERLGCLELAVSRKTGSAHFSDATQLSLFTADGLLRAMNAIETKDMEVDYTRFVFYSYQLWFYTQTETLAGGEYAWLLDEKNGGYKSRLLKSKGLFKKRYLDSFTLDTLGAIRECRYGRLNAPINSATDNNGLKRVIAAGLFFSADPEQAFRMAAEFAAITHGDPSAYLSAGCYAAITALVLHGIEPRKAAQRALAILKDYRGFETVHYAVSDALELLDDDSIEPQDAVDKLGRGEEAAEALAIAVYCASLHVDDFEHAIQLAANHDGASDTCAALTGGILGAYHGIGCIPKRWVRKLQYKKTIAELAYNLSILAAPWNETDAPDEPENGQDTEKPERREKPAKKEKRVKKEKRKAEPADDYDDVDDNDDADNNEVTPYEPSARSPKNHENHEKPTFNEPEEFDSKQAEPVGKKRNYFEEIGGIDDIRRKNLYGDDEPIDIDED